MGVSSDVRSVLIDSLTDDLSAYKFAHQYKLKHLVLANRVLLVKLLIETYKPVPGWKILELPPMIGVLGGM